MTQTYHVEAPIWCAGCGHFGVKNAIMHAIKEAGVELHETMVLAGIGCSGTVQNNVGAYGYHSMHGRARAFDRLRHQSPPPRRHDPAPRARR